MNSHELFKAGKLQEAIDAQTKEVKDKPGDQGKRLFLFELLAFAGDLERARRQIEAINYEEPELVAALLEYRAVLDAEQARRQLFSAGTRPKFFGEPPEHVTLRLDAADRLRENKPKEAADLLAKASAGSPLHGHLNDKPFDSFVDCDDLFGTVLEVFARGVYYWVPFEHIETIMMNPPKTPRDLLWVPARLELKEQAGNVHLPAHYPGSSEHPDNQIKLGRLTDWTSVEGGPTRGVGVRLFLAGDDTVSILDLRQLEFGSKDG